MMKKFLTYCVTVALLAAALPAMAFRQFPYDIPNPAGGWIVDWANDGTATGTVPNFIGLDGLAGRPLVPAAVSKRLAAGDGYSKMADGTGLYTFGFSDGSADPENLFMERRTFKAELPAPTISYYEGQDYYLTLTNVGMKLRPDLFDPHSVHFHGFPQAAPVFDGEPMASFGIRMGFDLTYYYNLVEPGTYLYHCHVEATEHMEMGMLGNLYIKPRQDLYAQKNLLMFNGFNQFAYNDCNNLPSYKADKSDFEAPAGVVGGTMCGSTGYDVEKAIQFSDFDAEFHKLHIAADTLPFADMLASHYMLNGRGYPDTVGGPVTNNASSEVGQPDYVSQPLDSKITANQGQKILLRLSNLSIQNFATLEFNGPAFKVVGKCAKLLRGPDGKDLSYFANSVFIGPGETFDLILDTTGWAQGTYYFYSRNLNQLNNDQMERGGAMTEIIIN